MTWRDRWILRAFWRVILLRWARMVFSAGLIACVIFAVCAVLDQIGLVRDPLMSPEGMYFTSLGTFFVAVCAALTGFLAMRMAR